MRSTLFARVLAACPPQHICRSRRCVSMYLLILFAILTHSNHQANHFKVYGTLSDPVPNSMFMLWDIVLASFPKDYATAAKLKSVCRDFRTYIKRSNASLEFYVKSNFKDTKPYPLPFFFNAGAAMHNVRTTNMIYECHVWKHSRFVQGRFAEAEHLNVFFSRNGTSVGNSMFYRSTQGVFNRGKMLYREKNDTREKIILRNRTPFYIYLDAEYIWYYGANRLLLLYNNIFALMDLSTMVIRELGEAPGVPNTLYYVVDELVFCFAGFVGRLTHTRIEWTRLLIPNDAFDFAMHNSRFGWIYTASEDPDHAQCTELRLFPRCQSNGHAMCVREVYW